MKTQIKITPAWLLWAVFLLLIMPDVSFAQQQKFEGKNKGHLYSEVLGKYLKEYTVYEMDTKAIAAFVKSHSTSAEFQLGLSGLDFQLNMEMNDLRGEDFKVVAMGTEGATIVPQKEEGTYKGKANKDVANVVRLNIDHSTFEGYIKNGKRYLYFDMLSRYLPNDKSNAVVVYYADNVIPDENRTCGSEKLLQEKNKYQQNLKPATGNCHFLEIATEADYEYYQAYGSDANAAMSRIRNILNLVEGVYTPSFDVKFIIRYQQIWTTISDPYSGDTLQGILPQFANWWATNRSNITRDETQLYTGRTVSNTTVGLAYVGVICNTTYYYSSVVNYSPVSNSTVILSAHEMGHNFGANHDAACNGQNIMCPYVQSGTPQWSSQSLTEMGNYINSSGSCMTESFSTNATLLGLNATFGYVKKIATNSISLNSSIAPFTFSTSGFGYIEAGSSILLTPTNANSQGFYAPEGSVVLIRISDVSATCDPLFSKPSYAKQNAVGDKDNVGETGNIRLFPNPFSKTFTIDILSKEATAAQVNIYNEIGILMKANKTTNLTKGRNQLTVDGSIFSPGMYMVEIITGNAKTVRKVVKF